MGGPHGITVTVAGTGGTSKEDPAGSSSEERQFAALRISVVVLYLWAME